MRRHSTAIKKSDGEHVMEWRRYLFLTNRYFFTAPPVCSARWTLDDWCNYVTFTLDKPTLK